VGEPERAMRAVTKALAMVEDELEGRGDPLLVFVPRELMLAYRANLREMYRRLSQDDLPAVGQLSMEMSHTIIYEWPYTYLGSAVVNAERAFREACADRSGGERPGQ